LIHLNNLANISSASEADQTIQKNILKMSIDVERSVLFRKKITLSYRIEKKVIMILTETKGAVVLITEAHNICSDQTTI
jgi:hypothetical protein